MPTDPHCTSLTSSKWWLAIWSQINKPQFSLFSYCQKSALTNNYISTRSGTIWKLSNLRQQVGPQLLFGTDAITYGSKFVPTTAKPLLVYSTECKLQKKHVQYRFMDALKTNTVLNDDKKFEF